MPTVTLTVVFRDGTTDSNTFETPAGAIRIAKEEAKWETCHTATVTVDGVVVFTVEGDFVA